VVGLSVACTVSGGQAAAKIPPARRRICLFEWRLCVHGTDAVLNVGDLESLLASGNVEVSTTGSDAVQAGSIKVSANLAWSNISALTLDAYRSIAFDAAVLVTGQGGVTLTTNDGGSGGSLRLGNERSLTFANLANALTINGTAYMLVDGISALASAVAASPAGSYALASNYDTSGYGTYYTRVISTGARSRASVDPTWMARICGP